MKKIGSCSNFQTLVYGFTPLNFDCSTKRIISLQIIGSELLREWELGDARERIRREKEESHERREDKAFIV